MSGKTNIHKNLEGKNTATVNREQFDKTFLETLDETLEFILGEGGKQVIYYYLQNIYEISKEGILERPELFTDLLNKFFGVGAKIIEKEIVKKQCQKLGIDFEQVSNIGLIDFIKKFRT
ncbi:MAG: hypothetical protein QXQ33_05500 [Nitrososphaerota archaeon]